MSEEIKEIPQADFSEQDIKSIPAIVFYKSVSKTNPKMVKKAKLNGVNVDTVDPMYQQEEATRAFNGLYGETWGIKNISFSTRTIQDNEIMTLNGIFYHPRGEFEYAVSLKSSYVSSKGNLIIDVDVEKKLLTSFKSKCLSLLGFNSDIFLNKFSDHGYVTEMFSEFELCSPEQMQTIRKGLSYYKVDAALVNEHFIISTLSELPASQFEQAQAFIKQLGEDAKKKKEE